jgi:hypothetical protein
MPVFTMDLPALGKALDASLSNGRLILDGLNHSGSRFPHTKIPRLFWGLWSRLIDDNGYLLADIDPNVVLFLRTLLYVGKNFQMDCPPRYLYETTKEYYDVEGALPPSDPFWNGRDSENAKDSDPDFGSLSDYRVGNDDLFHVFEDFGPDGGLHLLTQCQHFADRVVGELGICNPDDLHFRHGPGAVSELSTREYKYSFRYWGRRLEADFPYDRYGTSAGRLEEIGGDGYEDIEFSEFASRLIAVPKTQKGPRLIAAEPVSHQWIQQGLRGFLYDYVERKGSLLYDTITFRSQIPSRDLALRASECGTLCTIDLKSASDRLSTHLVQRIFRKNPELLEYFAACRTRYIENSVDRKMPGLHKLRKFSTQGSALTFPVQSYVFAILVIGVGKYLNPRASWRSLAKMVRVFGDDIIAPTSWEPTIRKVLHLVGLRVNQAKTHTGTVKKGINPNTCFRESCGMDAFGGYEVTPPYVTRTPEKSSPRSVASNLACSNNFYVKGFWHAAEFVASTIRNRYTPVVGSSAGVLGLLTFGEVPKPAFTRWNKNLHRNEARIQLISARQRVHKQGSDANLLQYFTEKVVQEPSYLKPTLDLGTGVVTSGDPVTRVAWVDSSDLNARVH